MRRPLLHTKVTVKLRKSIFREEWYLYIESYPVRNPGSTKPKRVIEAVNRTITTPIWDMTAISKIDVTTSTNLSGIQMASSNAHRSWTRRHVDMPTRYVPCVSRSTTPP